MDHLKKVKPQVCQSKKKTINLFINIYIYMHFFVCLNYKILFLINTKIILNIILYAEYFGHGPVSELNWIDIS